MLVEAILIAVVTYLAKFFSLSFANLQMRPIILGPIVGLVLGDFQQGIIIGAALEAVFLGIFGVGGSLPSDTEMGAIIGTSFAILMSKDVGAAVALAVPVGLISVFIYQLIKIVWHNAVVSIVDKSIENGNNRRFEQIHIFAVIVFGIPYAIISFIAILVGVEPINNLMNNLPQVVNDFLTIASRLLPALGFGLLLKSLWDKEIIAFYFLGFGLAAYLGLDTMGIALFGTVVAVVYAMNYFNKQKLEQKLRLAGESSSLQTNESAKNNNTVDDFFN
ncbi:PTS sugar transporter subunit IIC [Niallia sp. Man26]|uniref:PTS mannose/fructose/sorbose/N-acetylgalactosamine transporter subunit IIC n=1 Tax=Niallia sp. Man26 TaxID=2912824 RepID=UPI001EDC45B2|nr:PTS sugar transporter subunit IIC [Niallia sp. Man26]UPO90134.1 PTS sugar transporter subunit IIC [Niallia sp. Man26]